MIEKQIDFCEHLCKCGNVWSHFALPKGSEEEIAELKSKIVFSSPGKSHCFIPDVVSLPCQDCTKRELEEKKKNKQSLSETKQSQNEVSTHELIALLNSPVKNQLQFIDGLTTDEIANCILLTREIYRTLITKYNERTRSITLGQWVPPIDDHNAVIGIKELPKESIRKKAKKEKGITKQHLDDSISSILISNGFTAEQATSKQVLKLWNNLKDYPMKDEEKIAQMKKIMNIK